MQMPVGKMMVGDSLKVLCFAMVLSGSFFETKTKHYEKQISASFRCENNQNQTLDFFKQLFEIQRLIVECCKISVVRARSWCYSINLWKSQEVV